MEAGKTFANCTVHHSLQSWMSEDYFSWHLRATDVPGAGHATIKEPETLPWNKTSKKESHVHKVMPLTGGSFRTEKYKELVESEACGAAGGPAAVPLHSPRSRCAPRGSPPEAAPSQDCVWPY